MHAQLVQKALIKIKNHNDKIHEFSEWFFIVHEQSSRRGRA